MKNGGKRPGAGRPKGSKDPHTLTKDLAREHARQRIMADLDPILNAAIKRALGISYLVTRDAGSGKFIRVTSDTLASTETVIEVWEKEPDMAAVRELLDRCLDKAKEQALDVNVTGDWDKLAARLAAARERVTVIVSEPPRLKRLPTGEK